MGKTAMTSDLIKCSECNSFVRSDRLPQHINKVHNIVNGNTNELKSNKNLSSRKECPFCHLYVKKYKVHLLKQHSAIVIDDLLIELGIDLDSLIEKALNIGVKINKSCDVIDIKIADRIGDIVWAEFIICEKCGDSFHIKERHYCLRSNHNFYITSGNPKFVQGGLPSLGKRKK